MATRRIGAWFKANRRKVLVHSCILGSFLLYSVFLAGPLFDRVQALPGEATLTQVKLPASTNNVTYSLERFVVTPTTIEIQGWAFITGYDADNSHTFIVLESPRKTYVFESSTVYSSPVTAQYSESGLNLDWSGFTTIIPTRKIERGDYLVGVYIVQNGVKALQYTDKAVVTSSDSGKFVASDISDLQWLTSVSSFDDW